MKKNIFMHVCIAMFTVILMVFSITGCTESTEAESSNIETTSSQYDETVERVRNNTYYIDSDVTFGEAFDNFFGNYTWESIPDDGLGHFCRFTGYCYHGDDPTKCEIEFIEYDDGSVVADTLKIDGVEEEFVVLAELLDSVFEDYYNDHPSANTENSNANNSTVDSNVTSNEEVEDNDDMSNGYFVPSNYIVDPDDFDYYTNMDEFIGYCYAELIYDYSIVDYDALDEYGYTTHAIDVTFYMVDDYGWDKEDYWMVAYDIREALQYYYGFYNFGYITFDFSSGGGYSFYYDDDEII